MKNKQIIELSRNKQFKNDALTSDSYTLDIRGVHYGGIINLSLEEFEELRTKIINFRY